MRCGLPAGLISAFPTIPPMTLSARAAAALFAGTLLAGAAAGSETPLIDAAKAGDLARVQSLLEADPAAANQSGPDGSTALHWAVDQDHLGVVEALLGAQANAQARNRYGFGSIALAAMNGNADILTRLIHAGADPRATVPGGESAIMTAARTGDPDAIRVLLAAGADPKALPTRPGRPR